MKRRGGAFSLLELVIVMALASLVMTLAATTLIAVLRINAQAAGDIAQDVAVFRLAKTWRDDLHRSVASQIDGGCLFELPDGRKIRYSFAAPAVKREVLAGGEVRAGEKVEQRDAFVLPKRAKVTFAKGEGGDERLHRLRIEPGPEPNPALGINVRPLVIEAALNLHQAEAGRARP